MLSIAHMATGAFIAQAIPNPLISTPLILASHYLEDYILHWDVGTGLSKGKKTPIMAFKHELVDMFLAFVFIFIIFQLPHPTINYSAWFGAFVSLIPDFIEAPKNFFKIEPNFIKPLNRFHHRFHHSTPNVLLGLAPQILLLMLISILA